MTPLDRLGAMILAAGLSRRMGGPNKLLQPYLGAPLIEHTFRTVAALGLLDAVVVTGRDSPEIGEIAKTFGLRASHNAAYAAGLGTSIATGAADLATAVEGIFVVLGDMPRIARADFEALAAAFEPGAIVLPAFGQASGHPVLFCASYREELATLSGDEGARSILRRHPAALRKVATTNRGVLLDVDTPSDFASS